MLHKAFYLLVALAACLSVMFFLGCGDDDDDDNDDDTQVDDDDDDDNDDDNDDNDNDDDDDDNNDNDDNDDDNDDFTPDPTPVPNPDARADAFKLFYKERSARTALSYNRFGVAGDAVAATTIGKYYISKTGNQYEVVAGPNDNNPIGISAFNTWNLYKAIGGRDLELTLIRQFEGLVFSERVSGHEGLTCREALPGWTRVMDGVSDTITRTRFGDPVTPGQTYAPALEQEILDAFYDGLVITYRENPGEYYPNFKAINELNDYAITFVFSDWDNYLTISNCCSSWMISQIGDWEGAYWANHNSRDNFTDYAMGYLAAFEAEQVNSLPADLALAASNAAAAGRRTGDRIADDGFIQMTVREGDDYNDLIPGGAVRPDGTTEWQDLGSISSCQMAYTAQAMTSEGLDFPVPEVPLPGAIETSAIQLLFDLLGLPLQPPALTCQSMDDAFVGLGWGEILELEAFGMPWYDFAALISQIFPDLLNELLGSTQDDFKELVLGAVALCYYAEQKGDDPLYNEARKTLKNLVEMTWILSDLVYNILDQPGLRAQVVAAVGEENVEQRYRDTSELLYMIAMYARMFDIDSPIEDFAQFGMGNDRLTWIESQLYKTDTSPWALKTDDEIAASIEADLAGKEPWIQQRYRDRFGYSYPVRRAGEGYECIGPENTWIPTENPRHFWFGSIKLWTEAALCNMNTDTLDCSWAAMGCAPADLNDSGAVDADDTTLFDAAWTTYGEGATCSGDNSWCDGADFDQSGILDADDQGYLTAAQGCTT